MNAKFASPIFIALVTFAALFVSAPVMAQSDTQAPVVLDLRFEPEVIDTSLGAQTITVTARITDDWSGVEWAFVTIKPAAQKFGIKEFIVLNEGALVSGSAYDGVYQTTFVFEASSLVGTWNVESIYSEDEVGNSLYAFSEDDYKVLGGPQYDPSNESSIENIFAPQSPLQSADRKTRLYLPALGNN